MTHVVGLYNINKDYLLSLHPGTHPLIDQSTIFLEPFPNNQSWTLMFLINEAIFEHECFYWYCTVNKTLFIDIWFSLPRLLVVRGLKNLLIAFCNRRQNTWCDGSTDESFSHQLFRSTNKRRTYVRHWQIRSLETEDSYRILNPWVHIETILQM